jgi:hypothetical protein
MLFGVRGVCGPSDATHRALVPAPLGLRTLVGRVRARATGPSTPQQAPTVTR